MSVLLTPLKIGDIEIKNRIVMAPLTRQRAVDRRSPNVLMRNYYAQRSGAGLIISEATSIEPMGVGYVATPGIWSKEQINGWRLITSGVQAKGGKIFLQLWHVGRISDPELLNGAKPVAPSAITPAGHVSLLRPMRPYVEPRALSTQEVKELVQTYKQAAINAKEAGFDGVEIHAANGYLIDQFLQSSTNLRSDQYGGTLENRARFLLEITDALVEVWGAGRVGVHLAPRGDSHDMGDANPKETFGYVARELGQRNIAFIFLRESQGEGYLTPYIKQEFKGVVIANEGITPELGEQLINDGSADAISWGKLFISNPDLVERIKVKAPFNEFNTNTFYTHDEQGYTDYPSLN